jgi:signal transduction histidine kinase
MNREPERSELSRETGDWIDELARIIDQDERLKGLAEQQTDELAEAYKGLRAEIKEPREAEEALRQSQSQSILRHAHAHLMSLLDQRERADVALRESHRLLQLKQEELRALAGQLITVQEEERKRLARELHDGLNQKLAFLAMRIEWLEQHLPASPELTREQLRSLSSRVVELSGDVRRLAHQLHPSILEDLGLAVALRSYANSFSDREGITVRVTTRDLPESLPKDLSSCLYRVAQESLRNVAKHAHTKEVVLTLAASGQDSGVGFEPDSVMGKGGLGLISMRERVRLVNGNFSVNSHAASGTEVAVWIPLPGGGL